MEIAGSARKHGISDEDILHAASHAFRQIQNPTGEGVLLIGADYTGRLLEIVVLDLDTEDETAIHADALRPKFYRYL
jgi:hypothetical protein